MFFSLAFAKAKKEQIERWPSGLRRTLGKRVCVNSVSRVRIPSSLRVQKVPPEKMSELAQVFFLEGLFILRSNMHFQHSHFGMTERSEVIPLSKLAQVFFLEGLFILRSNCLLYTSPSPRDLSTSRMPSSA